MLITELKSVLVPRLFWDLALLLNGHRNKKAIEVHDFLTSETSSPFNIAILNQVPDRGAAQMALELYNYYFAHQDAPRWFAKAIEGIEAPQPL
jgi:hypothetical protein